MRRLIVGAAIAALTISYIASSADTVDRPAGVAANEWVSISPSFGIVVVPGPDILVGSINSDTKMLQMPPGGMPMLLRQPIGGYFMVKTGNAWTRLVVIEPMKGPADAG
jgi:hypothetical protein